MAPREHAWIGRRK
jgi:hypothetical protein